MKLDVDVLRSELRRLRRDEGRTLVKLLASPTVRLAVGEPPEAELLERFDADVSALGNDLKSLALKHAFGIGLKDPGTLTNRRITFGAQKAVSRGPETVTNWENEKVEELVARLIAGTSTRADEHLLVAVAVENRYISVVGEGVAMSGRPQRQLFNPVREPFIPAFIYQLPMHARVNRLTISTIFIDEAPSDLYSEGAGDLLAFLCGDGKRRMELVAGSFGEIEAVCWAAVHWDRPEQGIFYGTCWRWTLDQSGIDSVD